MARITAEMKGIAAKAKVFSLATATKEGESNVVPITFAKVLCDDELLLVDVFMRKTRQNIDANSRVAVSVWDTENSAGYQFKGNARVELSGKTFDEGTQWVKSVAPQLSSKAAVIVKVDEIYSISAGPDAGKGVG